MNLFFLFSVSFWISVSVAILFSFGFLRGQFLVAGRIARLPGRFWMQKFRSEEDLGHILSYASEFYEVGVCKLYFAIFSCALIVNAEAAKVVLSSSKNIDKNFFYQPFKDALGKGLIGFNGDGWRARRKLLTSSFHNDVISGYVPIFTFCVDELVEKVKTLHGGKGPCTIVPLIQECLLRNVYATITGTNLKDKAENEKVSRVFEEFKGLSTILRQRFAKVYLVPNFIFRFFKMDRLNRSRAKNMDRIISRLLEEKKYFCEDPSPKPENEKFVFVKYLQDAGIEKNDAINEIKTYAGSAIETTTAAIFCSLFYLGQNPSVQEKLYGEISDYFGGKSERIGPKDLNNLPYLDRVCKETLRLSPPALFFGRRLVEEVRIGDHAIPEGATVSVFSMGIHRDPKYFPDPDRFDPDRFLPESANRLHPFAYIPFSAGSRNCIGKKLGTMNFKIALLKLLENFEIFSDPNVRAKSVSLGLYYPSDEMKISLNERTKEFQD